MITEADRGRRAVLAMAVGLTRGPRLPGLASLSWLTLLGRRCRALPRALSLVTRRTAMAIALAGLTLVARIAWLLGLGLARWSALGALPMRPLTLLRGPRCRHGCLGLHGPLGWSLTVLTYWRRAGVLGPAMRPAMTWSAVALAPAVAATGLVTTGGG